jgi:TolB-like protein/tetratricopeptide (TPR) repeat protein
LIEIPGYTVLREIGHGGMASVYLAEQRSLKRKVALKVLSSSLAPDSRASERFLLEAHTVANLHHPNIISIHDVGVHEGIAYIAMDYEPDGTVAPVDGVCLEPNVALRIVRDIALALGHAHSRGVVHRDVKPENILKRADGSCVLSDFGIARVLQSDKALTQEDTSVGTPQYMSPEQLQGHAVDGRSDLYSLGVVLFQLLVGTPPYGGTDGWAIGVQHITAEIPKLPRALVRFQPLIERMMAKDPKDRQQTGEQLAREIDRILATKDSGVTIALPTPAPSPSMKPRGLRVGLIAAACVVAAVLALALYWRAPSPSSAAKAVPAAATATAGAVQPNPDSIAVMPFVDMSIAHDQEYMSDGMTEELLNLLAKIPQLRVIARTSSFAFKGQHADIAEISKRLKVAYILEGSVRKAGNRIRITAQLIRCADSTHLWSETYDRDLDDVFDVQDEISAAVVAQLRVHLLGEVPKSGKVNPKAYALYLKAQQAFRLDSPQGYSNALSLYEQALALDPDFAPAEVGMAATYLRQSNSGLRPMEQGYSQARAAAMHALASDPNYPQAHGVLAWIAMTYDRDPAAAAKRLDQALALAPGDPDLIRNAASLAASMGRFEQAIALGEYGVGKDPLNSTSHNNLGLYYEAAHRYDEAIASWRTAISLAPDRMDSHYSIGVVQMLKGSPESALKSFDEEPSEMWQLIGRAMAYPQVGRQAEGDAALAKLEKEFGDDGAYDLSYVRAYRGDTDGAFDSLHKAAVQQEGFSEMLGEVLFDGIRHDKRWLPFLRSVGKAPEQLAKIRFAAKPPPT